MNKRWLKLWVISAQYMTNMTVELRLELRLKRLVSFLGNLFLGIVNFLRQVCLHKCIWMNEMEGGVYGPCTNAPLAIYRSVVPSLFLLKLLVCWGVWQYGLWSFQEGSTRFLHKNQHTQRKLLNFEFWINGELSKIGHHFSSKKY